MPRAGFLRLRFAAIMAEHRGLPRSRALAVGLSVAVGAAGCGAVQPRSQAPAPSSVHAAFTGSPPALTALHAQANRLLSGGRRAFKARLSALHGHPVVVNVWASWCPPCRAEFPLFQTASVRFGRHVAFLGVDTLDRAGDARSFLRRYPVAYPNYEDGSGTIEQSLVPTQGVPMTIFIDARGHITYFHQGAYQTERQLRADIERYAEHT